MPKKRGKPPFAWQSLCVLVCAYLCLVHKLPWHPARWLYTVWGHFLCAAFFTAPKIWAMAGDTPPSARNGRFALLSSYKNHCDDLARGNSGSPR